MRYAESGARTGWRLDRHRRQLGVAGVVWGLTFAGSPLRADQAEPQDPFGYDEAVAQMGMDTGYGYVRALDGSGTLIQGDPRERIQVSVNEPVLAGDRLFSSGESRIEVVLGDGHLVRIGDGAELFFRAIASSEGGGDPGSVLELARGRLQFVVADAAGTGEPPILVTPNATIRPAGPGSFLIVVDGLRSEVVVRDGAAEVTTETELAEVRRGERLFVEGARGDRLDFAAAPGLDRLEAWGRDVGGYAGGEYTAHVDPNLHYGASTLRGHGSWVHVDAGFAWRPHVSSGWAPYRHGRWRHTPSGLFWVSYEPWGWVPYHYGTWDLHPHWGWIWFPGRRFAGAHVYWYWGPSYAGWIPSGYYWRHYRGYYGSRWGFHFGVYGHIGGSFGRYRHWTFLPHGRLGHRRQFFYAVSGSDLGRRRSALERGVLLTDTRSLGRRAWQRPAETLAGLRRAVRRDGSRVGDANAFIDRRGRLPQEIERVVLRSRDGRSARPRDATVGARSGASRATGTAPVRVTRRSVEGRTLRPERPGVQRMSRPRSTTETRPAVRRPTARESTGAPRRPVVRPATRSGSGSVQRSAPRASPRTPTGGDGVRRILRERGASGWPSIQRTRAATTRPTARSNPTRPSARAVPTWPQVRPTTARPSRPSLRGTPSTRRPAMRQSVPRSPRPTVRPAGPSRSSGVVRRSGGASRPSGVVRRSGGGSRGAGVVRRSGGSSRSTGVARARGRPRG